MPTFVVSEDFRYEGIRDYALNVANSRLQMAAPTFVGIGGRQRLVIPRAGSMF